MYTVMDSHKHKIVKEFDAILDAVAYILKHDNSDGWYNLEIAYSGYNDVHVWTALDAAIISAAFCKVDTDKIFVRFQYRLNGNHIRYNQDYEYAYDLAAQMCGVELEQIKHIEI
jgi:hypothetical protein